MYGFGFERYCSSLRYFDWRCTFFNVDSMLLWTGTFASVVFCMLVRKRKESSGKFESMVDFIYCPNYCESYGAAYLVTCSDSNRSIDDL